MLKILIYLHHKRKDGPGVRHSPWRRRWLLFKLFLADVFLFYGPMIPFGLRLFYSYYYGTLRPLYV